MNKAKLFKTTLAILFWTTVFVILYTLSRFNYLLFHAAAELTVFATGLVIFIIATNTRQYVKNHYFLFLGISLVSVSVIELLHTITYKGMGIIPNLTANTPTQYWIAGRYLYAGSLLASPLFLNRSLKTRHIRLLEFLYAVLVGAAAITIMFKVFPACYLENSGLTKFKVISEYVVSLLLIGSAAVLLAKRSSLNSSLFKNLMTAYVFSVLAELSFTHYVSVYGFFNFLGHFLLILSMYFIYRGLIRGTLTQPIAVLFKELRDANQQLDHLASHDGLTGLFNRRKSLEEILRRYELSFQKNEQFCVAMLDIDCLKTINDTYGHLAGDGVLNEFAKFLKKSFGPADILGRYGGSEFIICPMGVGAEAARPLIAALMAKAKELDITFGHQNINITVSAGICGLEDRAEFLELIDRADRNLLESKKKGPGTLTVTAG